MTLSQNNRFIGVEISMENPLVKIPQFKPLIIGAILVIFYSIKVSIINLSISAFDIILNRFIFT